jgi:hypothetical protein
MISAAKIATSVLFGLACSAAIAATADIASPVTRQAPLKRAQELAAEPTPVPLPSSLVNPFNPPAFGEPDPEEQAAIAAAKAAEAAAAVKDRPATEADLLARIAEKITPSGTVTIGNEPLLIFGQKRLRVGDTLTVSYDGKDYKVELTAIQRSTFSLRFNRAELTRRINP